MIGVFRTCALPYARLELPGWGKVLRLARVCGSRDFDADWTGAPTVTTRGRSHGYLMRLNLANQIERKIYYLGRFQDLELEHLLRAVLRPGDAAIDVGANIGMTTLLMSRLVGAGGTVHSFEPNPVDAARVEDLVRLNRIANVRLHNVALGPARTTMTLKVIGGWSVSGTLGNLSAEQAAVVSDSHEVRVETGDSILNGIAGPAFLKIDVEGFECHVLSGMTRFLAETRPAIVTEVDESLLTQCGSGGQQLFAMMKQAGYRAFGLQLHRALFGHRLALDPINDWSHVADARAGARADQRLVWQNVLWLTDDGVHRARLAEAGLIR